ncbi:pentatricopeptide repeat (PPR) superfamily protein isoform X1 [Wolffia australiana]
MELQASCGVVLSIRRGSSRKEQIALKSDAASLPPLHLRRSSSSIANCRRNFNNSTSISAASCSESSLEEFSTVRPSQLSGIKPQYLEETDDSVLSERLLKLCRNNKILSALELFASMSALGIKPNSHACNSLIACLTRNNCIDDALAVFEILRREKLATEHTFSIVLKAVAEAKGCRSAVEIFSEVESEENKLDTVVYNTMISICGRSKNWIEAERLWNRLRQRDCAGSILTYRLLISIFVQCGQPELALSAYDEMIKNGLQPDEDSMKGIISVCTKEGNWRSGLAVFNQMINSGVQPNAVAFNSIINCLGKAGETDQAFKIYDLMKNAGLSPDVYTWTALLNSLYRSGRYSDALRLFEFISKGDEELNPHLCNVALMSCQRLRRWDRSLQILWKMEESEMYVPPESYNLVILACERANQAKVAVEVYEHMIHRKCVPDTFTHLSLIRACIWGSLWAEVDGLLKRVEPSASLYNTIIQGLFLRGKAGSAKKLYEKLRANGLEPDGKTRALMLQYSSEKPKFGRN